ncbi:MAG: hypothetical protein JXN64_15935 [Spirochaetes bacterium]|nr:hypothetical protein [Spirochaetota bacterium]
MKPKPLIYILFLLIIFFTVANAPVMAQRKTKSRSTSSSPTVYKVPPRMIIVSPYFSYIYANNLFEDTIKDGSGFGGGLNIRTQVYKEFGFLIDALYTNLEIEETNIPGVTEEEKSDIVAIFSGGFYYSFFYHSLTDMRFDLAYGAITAGDNVMTIFIPALEFFIKASDRILLFAKLSWLIANDWFVDLDYKEHYTSFSASAGFSIIF